MNGLRAQFSDHDWMGQGGSAHAPMGRTLRWAFRLAGAGLLVAMAWIHLHLYATGYSTIKTIGPLFLLNGVLGLIAAIAVVVTPARWLPPVTAGGAMLLLGTLGALVLSLTVGLFGFKESTSAPLVTTTIAVEAAGFLVLASHALYDGGPFLQMVRRRRAGGKGSVGDLT
jgi:hypothetical protein